MALLLADKFSKPLFEIRPDLFPFGRLTSLEVKLWELHLKEVKKHNEK